jgi:hypothetical protein
MSIKKVLLLSVLLVIPAACSRDSSEASRQEQEATAKPPMETPPPVQDQAQAPAEVEPPATAYQEPTPTRPPAARPRAQEPARASGTATQQPRRTPEPATETAVNEPATDQSPVVVPPSPSRRADGGTPQADSSGRIDDRVAPAPVIPARPVTAVLTQGTILDVRLTQVLNSGVNQVGDKFDAILERELVVNGQTVAPRGSRVSGKVVEVEPSGKVKGLASMTLALTSIQTGEERYNLETNALNFDAENTKGRDAKVIGSGAAIGAAIGAIAGGKKGAAIGAAVGGGAGTAGVLATKGKEVDFQPEHKFSFRLERDVEMRVR